MIKQNLVHAIDVEDIIEEDYLEDLDLTFGGLDGKLVNF